MSVPSACGGDSAPFHTRDSIFLLLFNVLSGNLQKKRFWTCAFPKSMFCNCGCKGRHTFDDVFSVLLFACRAWLSGVWPRLRHCGQAFADSTRPGDKARAAKARGRKRLMFQGAVVQKRGDWPWFKQIFDIVGWKAEGASKRVCFKCACTGEGGECPYTDASLSAAWRRTMVSHPEWFQRALREGRYLSVLWSLPGFILSFITIDLMHCGELGILQYLLGNVLFELFVQLGGIVTRPLEAMGSLMSLIQVASKHLQQARPPVYKLSIAQIKASGKEPKLKTKAAETRYMLEVVTHILKNLMPPTTPHEVLRLQCCQSINDIYVELRQWDQRLSPPKVAKLARTHIILYAELCREALDGGHFVANGWHAYKMYPKHHLFVHLMEEQTAACGNPADFWNYLDEDAIGLCADMSEACHGGFLHRAVIDKYRL